MKAFTMPDTNFFREALNELYLLCCERSGWNPSRGRFQFQTKGQVVEGAIYKILSGRGITLERETINSLLDALNSDLSGILTHEEKLYWHEELHVARAVEMTKNLFVKQVNTNLDDLPFDVEETIEEQVRKLYKSDPKLWAVDGVSVAVLGDLLQEMYATHDEHLDNGSWEEVSRGLLNRYDPASMFGVKPEFFGLAVAPKQLPLVHNFVVTAVPRWNISPWLKQDEGELIRGIYMFEILVELPDGSQVVRYTYFLLKPQSRTIQRWEMDPTRDRRGAVLREERPIDDAMLAKNISLTIARKDAEFSYSIDGKRVFYESNVPYSKTALAKLGLWQADGPNTGEYLGVPKAGNVIKVADQYKRFSLTAL